MAFRCRLFLSVCVFYFLLASPLQAISRNRLPLELELSASDYRFALAKKRYRSSSDHTGLGPVISTGTRFLDWLNAINRSRDAAHQIALSSAATQGGYNIEHPAESNAGLVLAKFATVKKDLPIWFSDVIFGNGSFPGTFPVSDSDFVGLGTKIEGLYEAASRWILQVPQLKLYARAKKYDVRGYYYLTRLANPQKSLEGFYQLPDSDRAQMFEWLVGLCFNSATTEADCRTNLTEWVHTKSNLFKYFSYYLPAGTRNWNESFSLAVKRTDTSWQNGASDQFSVPFSPPPTSELKAFLVDNIEDEWRWKNWQLKLNFLTAALPHLAFEAGTTPHVDQVGGNTITMDQNASLKEYDVKWTIRHEFGHVIGFPDCYVEFYDANRGTMVSYQLDTSNLMCSRKGHFKEIHYTELRRIYFERDRQ